jgi:hypothetical protein
MKTTLKSKETAVVAWADPRFSPSPACNKDMGREECICILHQEDVDGEIKCVKGVFQDSG